MFLNISKASHSSHQEEMKQRAAQIEATKEELRKHNKHQAKEDARTQEGQQYHSQQHNPKRLHIDLKPGLAVAPKYIGERSPGKGTPSSEPSQSTHPTGNSNQAFDTTSTAERTPQWDGEILASFPPTSSAPGDGELLASRLQYSAAC